MPAADSKPDEDLDMFGYFPCSQRPGAWMGAAYMFFNALEKENDKTAAGQPSSTCTTTQASSSDRARSRSRSVSSKKPSEPKCQNKKAA